MLSTWHFSVSAIIIVFLDKSLEIKWTLFAVHLSFGPLTSPLVYLPIHWLWPTYLSSDPLTHLSVHLPTLLPIYTFYFPIKIFPPTYLFSCPLWHVDSVYQISHYHLCCVPHKDPAGKHTVLQKTFENV